MSFGGAIIFEEKSIRQAHSQSNGKKIDARQRQRYRY
jgi:hypothetical protein